MVNVGADAPTLPAAEPPRASGASRPAEPCSSSSQLPCPPAWFLYGGLPITTVMGLLLLDAVGVAAGFGDGRHHARQVLLVLDEGVTERVGDEELQVGRGLGVGWPRHAFISACISAISRSCATAKGPNCNSKPTTRLAAASMAPREPRLAPWSSARRWRQCGAARRAGRCRCRPPGSATVTCGCRESGRFRSNSGSAQRLIDQPYHGVDHLGRCVVGARALAQRSCRRPPGTARRSRARHRRCLW